MRPFYGGNNAPKSLACILKQHTHKLKVLDVSQLLLTRKYLKPRKSKPQTTQRTHNKYLPINLTILHNPDVLVFDECNFR